MIYLLSIFSCLIGFIIGLIVKVRSELAQLDCREFEAFVHEMTKRHIALRHSGCSIEHFSDHALEPWSIKDDEDTLPGR